MKAPKLDSHTPLFITLFSLLKYLPVVAKDASCDVAAHLYKVARLYWPVK